MFEKMLLKKYSKELKDLYAEENNLSDQYYDALETLGYSQKAEQIKIEMDKMSEKITNFIENDYAQAVFAHYYDKKPMLIRVRTGEEVSWDEAFGNDFCKVSKSLRHSLVGLVEEPGRYVLKQ